jgi:hypothetical protein
VNASCPICVLLMGDICIETIAAPWVSWLVQKRREPISQVCHIYDVDHLRALFHKSHGDGGCARQQLTKEGFFRPSVAFYFS